jgi:hypothetical protein
MSIDLDPWNDPDFAIGGDYVSFEKVGDTVTGRVVTIRKMKWQDGTISPQIVLDVNGEEKTVTAGQIRLKAMLAEKRPQPGQHLTITLTEIEKRAGGKTLKHFDVQVGSPAPAAAAAAPGGYSTEQLEAMRLLGIEPPQ